MENLKIRVNNEAENKGAQELFFELGYEWAYKNIGKNIFYEKNNIYLYADKGGNLGTGTKEDQGHFNGWCGTLVSLAELRALVALHKNPINMDKVLSGVRSDALGLIEDKPMKEWLNTETHEYKKSVDMRGHGKWIEIPEGAIRARFYPADPDSGIEFESQFAQWWHTDELEWIDYMDQASSNDHSRIVWQRHTQPEDLPFVDDKPSLNDQYAEIEQVRQASITDTLKDRQSTYGDFSMVAEMTQGLLFVMSEYGYNDMPDTHKESIHMIASKLARIINGNHDHKDSWHDIAGYATLVERSL